MASSPFILGGPGGHPDFDAILSIANGTFLSNVYAE